MHDWWTRCPVCGGPTRARGSGRGEGFLQRLMRSPWFPPLDFLRPARDTFVRECPEHGVVALPKLRFEPHECQQCGYDLRAIKGDRCPECGEAVPAGQGAYLDEL